MKKTILTAIAVASLAIQAMASTSGLKPGEQVTPFHPKHVVGPLAGTDKCFPCTFQNRPQVQVWVNGDDQKNIVAIAKTLDAAMAKHEKSELKALIVLLSDGSNDDKLAKMAKEAAAEGGLKHVAVAVLPKTNDAVKKYQINADGSVRNTVLAYKGWKVKSNLVNVKADEKGLVALNNAIADLVR